MSLWKIAWRSMQQRALASTLTGLSMALGVALVVSVLVVYGVISTSFTKGAQGFDMIVGAKGGKLQLVLNTVYHLSTPVENIPWSYYKKFITAGPGKFAARRGGGDSLLPGRQLSRLSRGGHDAADVRDRICPRPALSLCRRAAISSTSISSRPWSERWRPGKRACTSADTFQPTHGVTGRGPHARPIHRGRRARTDRHAQRSGPVRQHRRLLSARQSRQTGAGRMSAEHEHEHRAAQSTPAAEQNTKNTRPLSTTKSTNTKNMNMGTATSITTSRCPKTSGK